MEKMKTLIVEKDGALKVVECSLPQYNDCQALVKTISCGVCNGTDGKLIHKNFKGYTEADYPIMLGHEGVGRVVRVGSKVTSYKVGDIVILPFNDPIDGYTNAWGSYAEYAVVSDKQAYLASGILDFPDAAHAQQVLEEDVDPVKAPVIIMLREVLSSIKLFGIGANSSVVQFGCGPVGLTFIKLMHLLGVKPIIALDIVEEKLEWAKEHGADYAFLSNGPDAVKQIRELLPGGADFALDAVGVLDVINQSMGLIKDTGKICCYGISPLMHHDIDWSDADYNWQLHFQQMPSKLEEARAHNQVMAWLRSGALSMDDYISEIIDFDHILDAFEMLERKEIKKKCIIRYE